jgi:hypothetical protein
MNNSSKTTFIRNDHWLRNSDGIRMRIGDVAQYIVGHWLAYAHASLIQGFVW